MIVNQNDHFGSSSVARRDNLSREEGSRDGAGKRGYLEFERGSSSRKKKKSAVNSNTNLTQRQSSHEKDMLAFDLK